jgi:hypothetical protein
VPKLSLLACLTSDELLVRATHAIYALPLAVKSESGFSLDVLVDINLDLIVVIY